MPTLYQFSPVRSGSTLVYNILKDVFKGKYSVAKVHNAPQTSKNIVSTIRDPRDSLRSYLLLQTTPITVESIQTKTKSLCKGLNDLKKIQHKPNVLVLRYELFWDNYEYIFDSLEQFFSIKISPQLRTKIKEKYSINSMHKIADKYPSFSKWDKITHIHGKHISDTKGQPEMWKRDIPKEYHDYINALFKDYLQEFGYS